MSTNQLAKSLYISRESVERALAQFAKQGLVECTERGYVYAPVNSDLKNAIIQTSKAYSERRSSVINLIFAGPSRQGNNV